MTKKVLIVGEKPSIARKILEALRKDEKFSTYKGYYESENYIITYCVGHLLQLKMPNEIDEKYNKWDLKHLPFNFKEIPLKISESSKDQFKVIKMLFSRDDVLEIVNACDADREGELIFRNLLTYLKPKCKNISRMWIESVATDEIMLKTINNRKNQNLYDGLYDSAVARSYADYLLGLNVTEAMSIKYGGGKSISIGRVITPTLRIVTDLENKINNFKSEPFYKVSCDTLDINEFSYNNPVLEDNRFKTKKEAEKLIKKVGTGEALVKSRSVKEEFENPPKLFSLSDLQIVCSSKYKYTAQEVLDACQSLYEIHGLTTYPRTSENIISKEMADIALDIVDSLKEIYKDYALKIKENDYKINPLVVAKKDIASHEALTPTGKKVSESILQKLSIIEKNVYEEIAKRFLANFYPKAKFEVSNITIERNNEKFTKRYRILKESGFYDVLSNNTSKDNVTPPKINEGDIIEIVKFDLLEGKTEPPKRLTEGALIKIMQSPLKFLDTKEDKDIIKESGGIGTEATRAGVIENMKKNNFIEIKKSVIYPTEKGMKLIDIIPSETIKSVPLTAMFENKLKLIKENKYEKERFLEEIMINVEEFVEDVKEKEDVKIMPTSVKDEICKCPNCGSSIIENKFGFGCSDWKNCKVQIYADTTKRFGGKKITKTMAKELFTTGETKKQYDFVSVKTGKEYKAYLTYDFNIKDTYPNKIGLKFDK